MSAIVEQRVHRLLKHPFFIVDDDVGCFQLQKVLQAVVAINHTPVQIVEITRCKTTALQRNQGSQIGRNDGYGVKYHPLRRSPRVDKALNDLQSAGEFLLDLF